MGDKSDASDNTIQKIVVLGGGLAGVSAALYLLEHQHEVTLVEKRPFLGGRAFSFYDSESICDIDNGQHVFMGCCTYYLEFLRKLGVYKNTYLQSKLRTEIILNGKAGILSSLPALGPLHMLPSFVKYPHLNSRDKLRVLYGLLRAKLTNRSRDTSVLENQTFEEWLANHYQTSQTIKNFWSLIIVPTLNDEVNNVSANMALMVIQEGLMNHPIDAAIGFSTVGLTSLTGAPAQQVMEQEGCRVVLGKTIKAIRIKDGMCVGAELPDGSIMEADAYISALPFNVLLKALPNNVARHPSFASIADLRSSPIIGIHLWYDRTIMDQEFLVFLDSPIQWVFNRTLIQGATENVGQHVCISISSAWNYIDMPKDEIRNMFIDEMQKLFPKAMNAKIERNLIIKQPQATFRCTPGSTYLRPTQTTYIPNLFLAGEWTKTGWPSTMESAVRSGVLAAKAATASTE